MAKICPLFSGSKANCTYLASGNDAVLIDAGASCSATLRAIEAIGESADKIRAILITHEHTDHIKGLRALNKKLKVPVIASKGTLNALLKAAVLDENTPQITITDNLETDFGIIHRFATMHDCEDSSGYKIELSADCSAAVCTDLGVVTGDVRAALQSSSVVLLESNHDLRMLQNGPYPPELKIRIAGERGHLSNSAAAAELVTLLKSGTNRFILGHLSENNNLPTLAVRVSESALMDVGAKKGLDYTLYCAVRENRQVVYF